MEEAVFIYYKFFISLKFHENKGAENRRIKKSEGIAR
jgi:hypothetical protein